MLVLDSVEEVVLGGQFVGLLIGVGILMLVCFWIGDRA